MENQFIFIVSQTMQESSAQSCSVPVALAGPGPEVNGKISHWLVPLSQERSSKSQTLRISSEKVWNDVQEGVDVSHSAVPQGRVLLVRSLILCFALAS